HRASERAHGCVPERHPFDAFSAFASISLSISPHAAGGDMTQEWHQDGYTVSTDPQRLDLKTIHGFLTQAYWSPGIPMETVKRSIDNSVPFGIYQSDRL